LTLSSLTSVPTGAPYSSSPATTRCKELKKQVNEAEDIRNISRGPKSWYELRSLKKLKLRAKEVLNRSKGVAHT
jgi:hypothetical protein